MASHLFKDIVAYVEVRSNNDNRSSAVCRELQQLGARVESTFTDDVTHVVFKEGMRRTYNKAQKKGIPLVSVTWLESCKTNQRLMPEKDFTALIPEESNSPLPLFNPNRRWRKMKSMQPNEYEEEVARSAERSVKRRRRVEEANRFKLLEGSTPTSSSPSLILVPETQTKSPFFSDLSRSNSPSLATVADTPITPTMKDRIEKMRREQQNAVESGEHSPKGTGRQKPSMLQKRLFEKLAKDIFSREDSDEEDDDTTARVVAKLIDGLESQEEDIQSPRKKTKRVSSQENKQEILQKSPKQNSLNITSANNSNNNQHKTQSSSPRRRSLRNSPKKKETTSGIKEKEKDMNKRVQRSSEVLHTSDSCDSTKHSSLPGASSRKLDEPKCSDTLLNKRKKPLLSESDTFSTLVSQQQSSSYSHTKQLETDKKHSNRKEKEKLSEDISFLFGFKNKPDAKMTTNRRRSSRLSVIKSAHLSTSNNEELRPEKEKQAGRSGKLNTQPSRENSFKDCNGSDTNVESVSHQLVNDSMSVVYDQVPSLLNESSPKMSSRRSIDEFSLQSKGKKNNSHKHCSSLSNKKRNLRISDAGFSNAIASAQSDNNEEIATSGKKNETNSSDEVMCDLKKKKSKSSLLQSGTDLSEEENLPRKLRHVSSLVMEMSQNPQSKRSKLSLVMTSLHRDEQETVLSVVKKLGVFKVADAVDENTTHVVCGEPRRTLNLLQAISRGCWVLKKEWVLESLEADRWLVEENYEMVEDFPVVKSTRCNRMKKGRSYQTDLFSKCGPMLVAKTCVPSRKDLVDLITVCSGTITHSQQRAATFINDQFSSSRMNIKPTWILDSIMKMEVLDKGDYVVEPQVIQNRKESSPEF